MSDLTTFRDHCRKMTTTEHKPECSGLVRDRWGPKVVKPDPECAGCNPQRDRDLFALLAREVDEYLERDVREVDLFGALTPEPTAAEETP